MKPFHFFLALVAFGIVVIKMFFHPTGAPFADRKVEFDNDGWYYQGVHCFPNTNDEMMCSWREGDYIITSNTVTAAWSKERIEK
jgi:hypothetical protein